MGNIKLVTFPGIKNPSQEKPAFMLAMKNGSRIFASVLVYEWREYYEPHIEFFQASKREMYEGMRALIAMLCPVRPILAKCRDKYASCYDRWAAHGFCRKMGTQPHDFGTLHIYRFDQCA